jgi:hypothetical protein
MADVRNLGDRYRVKLTLLEDMLGTVSKDKEIYTSYIATKRAAAGGDPLSGAHLNQELETVVEVEEKGWTGFHMQDGKPLIYNYVCRGFFKDACGMLRRADGTLSKKLTAYKKVIDGLVFVRPRRIFLNVPEGTFDEDGNLPVNERPLRGQTAQGERVALARSDYVPAGTTLTFDVRVLGQVSFNLLTEWLSYGEDRGLGQWRNGGWGAFEYEIEKL